MAARFWLTLEETERASKETALARVATLEAELRRGGSQASPGVILRTARAIDVARAQF
jgi:hypothetical protein